MDHMQDSAAAENFESLRLANQLCFPLYACAKEVVRQYRRPLEELGLTYTQYIVMMVFWEFGSMTEKELGEKIHLDSGTLAPLLKRLEKQGLVTRSRAVTDERTLIIGLTEAGEALKYRAVSVPALVAECIKLNPEEALTLYTLLYRVLDGLQER